MRLRRSLERTDEIAPAMSLSSSGKPPSGSYTLKPMPMTAQSRPPDSMSIEASVSMPQVFLPRTNTSFTHLMEGFSSVHSSMARQAATAAAVVILRASWAGS